MPNPADRDELITLQKISSGLEAFRWGDNNARPYERMDTIGSFRTYLNVSKATECGSLQEAMLLGCVPVTTAYSKEAALIKNGVNGFVSNDAFELRNYLLYLSMNKARALEIGFNARNTIIQKYRLFPRTAAMVYFTEDDKADPAFLHVAQRFQSRICHYSEMDRFDLYDHCVLMDRDGRIRDKYFWDKVYLEQEKTKNKIWFLYSNPGIPYNPSGAYRAVDSIYDSTPSHPSICGAYEARGDREITLSIGKEVGVSFTYLKPKLSEIAFAIKHPSNLGHRVEIHASLFDRQGGKLLWDTRLQSSDFKNGYLSVRLGNPEWKAEGKTYYVNLKVLHGTPPEYPSIIANSGYSPYQLTEDRAVKYGSLCFYAF